MRLGVRPRQNGSARSAWPRKRGARPIWRAVLRPQRGGRYAWGHIALVVLAVLSATTGMWILATRTNGPAGLPVSAEVDGLAIGLYEAGWVPMDAHSMDSQGGFQMPAQMMPGAPAGNEMRLGIAVTLLNTADGVREFNLGEEVVLVGGVVDGAVRLHSDTFGLLQRLGPGSAVNGVLYFDTTVPATSDPALVLRWSRSGETFDLAIPLGSVRPAPHPHIS